MTNHVDVLKKVPIFEGLNDEEYTQVASLMKEREYKRDEVIFTQDQMGDALFVIVEGRVKVALYSEAGKEIILSILKNGDFFGEMSLLDGEPRSANVVSLDKSKILILERLNFAGYLEKSPTLTLKILKVLSKRLRIADEQIGSLALLDVYGRIARFLINLARQEGKTIGDEIHVEHRLTHQEIAGMIGTSRETVSRTFADLQKRNLITIADKKIVIQKHALEDIAEKYMIYGLK